MTKSNYKLPLKLEPYANHCLAWSIRDEITHGKHNFDGLRELVLSGKHGEVRRYAEVVYHKTMNEDSLFKTLIDSLNKHCSSRKNSVEKFVLELKDWGFRYSKAENKVSQTIKVLERN